MKIAFVHALSALAILATAGCVSSAEYHGRSTCSARKHAPPAAAVATGVESGVDAAHFGGTWVGQGCQSDGPCWTIRVAIDADEEGNPIGTIAYPSVPCAARLEFVRWEGEVAAFRERFRHAGKCVPDGWLRLRLLDEDRMTFEWSYPDGRVDAATTLDRAR